MKKGDFGFNSSYGAMSVSYHRSASARDKGKLFECNFPDQHDQGPTGCGKSSNLKHVVESPGIC